MKAAGKPLANHSKEPIMMIRSLVLFCAPALLALASAAPAHDGPHPTDAEIAHIAYTAGQIDIEAGRQALAKSSNKEVRTFAEAMVRDHEAVNDQALALVNKLGVEPAANATSAALSEQAKAKLQSLAVLKGAAFDKAYVDNEISFHRTVNSALGATLIPGAHNGELKSLLETGLTLFKEHQLHAEHLAGQIR
jgi:putative membrane protein